jgi:hypothetical protein
VKTAKKLALGVLAATVMSFVTPLTPASADQGDTLKGGCGFDTNQNALLTGGSNQGKIYVRAVSQEASGAPSGARVECWIDVDGVEQVGTHLTVHSAKVSGIDTGVVVGQQDISFESVTGDTIVECQRVTFDDGSTWTAKDGNVGTDCPPGIELTDQPPIDLFNVVLDLLNGVLRQFDPPICGVLRELAGNYGPVVIDGSGDTWVNDPLGLIGKVYDCPPYDV